MAGRSITQLVFFTPSFGWLQRGLKWGAHRVDSMRTLNREPPFAAALAPEGVSWRLK